MRLFSFLHPHNRWQRDVDAFADRQLTPSAAERFDRHLGGCAECIFAVEESRRLTQMLRAMPERPAPRSFRLTAAMVAGPAMAPPMRAAPQPAGRPAYGLRLAQAVGGLALVGLISAGVVDFASNGGSSEERASSALTNAAAEAPVAAAAPVQDLSSKGAAVPAQASATSAATAPAARGAGGASAAGGVNPTAAATEAANAYYDQSAPTNTENSRNGAPDPAAGVQDLAGSAPRPLVGTGDSDRTIRAIELLFGAGLAASVAGWLLLHSRKEAE